MSRMADILFTGLTLYAGDECTFDLHFAQVNFTLWFSRSFSYMIPLKDDSLTWYITADNLALYCVPCGEEYCIYLVEKPYTKHAQSVFIINQQAAEEIRSALDKVIAHDKEVFIREKWSTHKRKYQPEGRLGFKQVKEIRCDIVSKE